MKDYYLKQAEFFSERLHDYLKNIDNLQSSIYDAMGYSLFAGGKRLRPVLMSETCIMCGGSREDVVPFAAALEMIHTYSLIHDDLPAMDNDDIRRGMPTNHMRFGEAIAILAGDALLNKAFEVMSGVSSLPAETVLRAIKIISDSSGTEGMIGGQVVDVESEGREIDIDTLRYIHSLKTGAIIKSACVSGAVIAGAGTEEINAAADFAVNLGIAFQIQDDILDVSGDAEKLGKPIGSDAECGKCTYVTLLGEKRAYELMLEYSKKAENSLKIFGERAAFLKWLIYYLISREN